MTAISRNRQVETTAEFVERVQARINNARAALAQLDPNNPADQPKHKERWIELQAAEDGLAVATNPDSKEEEQLRLRRAEHEMRSPRGRLDLMVEYEEVHRKEWHRLPSEQFTPALLRLGKLAEGVATKVLARHGFSISKYLVLSSLAHSPNKHQQQLAKRLEINPNAMASIMGELEDGGLVSRHANRENRRKVITLITTQGQELFTTIAAEFRTEERRLGVDLDDRRVVRSLFIGLLGSDLEQRA